MWRKRRLFLQWRFARVQGSLTQAPFKEGAT
ncbi:hypothetical protein DES53_112128 [Roseimicrobium gellanilyticum]|uniref:Uncharacterized protein n=1 Tax=Roseimicrobium gellanilyticum TaxID=748857 RepID=A0A366H7J8_9BACT|nr:hypothetical protein DES53_112128 [Roseimicrobium gellanilyticum]